MLLILTGSADGTVDRIVEQCALPVFRLNLDLISDYKISMSPDGWEIENPSGKKIDSHNATRAFWWKAFSYGLDQEWLFHEEVKYLFRELYSWFGHRHLIIGNPPEAEARIGKLRQLEVASKHLKHRSTQLRINDTFAIDSRKKYIVKSLTSGLTTSSKAMHTQEVDPSKLDPKLLWLVQEKIDSTNDITVFVAGSTLYGFARSRASLTGLDWRKEQFTDQAKWEPYSLSENDENSIRNFCSEIGVEWGRVDFMLTEEGLIFLEINMNGQWVFLDLQNDSGFISKVVEYIETGPTHSQVNLRSSVNE